jgi:hypothetical protein
MGFRTIDLDTKEGMEQYEKLSKTHSMRETFGEDAVPKRKKKQSFVKPEERIEPVEEKKEEPVEEKVEETSKSVERREEIQKDDKVVSVAKGVVTGVSQLRVRKRPDGDVISVISHNTIVEILADEGKWLAVKFAPDKTGYVMSEYIRKYTETTGG